MPPAVKQEGMPPEGGVHDWEICDVGNFYTEYECKKCGTRTTIEPEDSIYEPLPGVCIVASSDTPDPVNHPPHYTDHPSGVECIQITEHMGFNLGNVVKYVWRCDLKHDDIEDLKKARFYLDREIEKREKQQHGN
jgi:hypothetical protein